MDDEKDVVLNVDVDVMGAPKPELVGGFGADDVDGDENVDVLNVEDVENPPLTGGLDAYEGVAPIPLLVGGLNGDDDTMEGAPLNPLLVGGLNVDDDEGVTPPNPLLVGGLNGDDVVVMGAPNPLLVGGLN